MSTSSDTQNSTKEDLCALLSVIVQDEEYTKQIAVQVLRKYDSSDEYPVHLTELALNPSCQLPVRILAATKLKDYVKAHWNPMAKDFTAPEMNTRNKTKIKELLPTGLSESNLEVRETVADVIAIVIPWEWPENWSEILDVLLNYLHGDNDFGFFGAMLVLDRFSLYYAAVPNVPLRILPVIVRVFESVDQYSAEVICLAVSIFLNIVHETARPGSTDFIQHDLQPAILLFFEASMKTWESQDSSSNLKLKIIGCVSSLAEILPTCIVDPLPKLLPMVLETFADCAKKYRAGTMDRDSQDLVEGLFAFINSLMFGSEELVPVIPEFQLLDDKWFDLIDSFVTLELLQHVLIFIEITENDIEFWKNEKEFVSEFFQMNELGEPVVDGSRRNAEEIFTKVAKHVRLPVRNVLIDMIMKPLDPENAERAASDPMVNENWWIEREALLLVFCLMKDDIMERLKDKTLCFDIMAFLNNVVLAHLNDSRSHPLLVARCFYLCGLYAAEMSMEMMTQCLEATIKGLRKDQPATVRVAAAQAVYRWFDHYAAIERKSGKELMVPSRIPALFEGLYSVAEDFSYREILTCVLKSIASMMPYDEAFIASVARRVSPLTVKALLNLWGKYAQSQWLIAFQQLMRNPGCIQSLQKSLIPILVRMMTTKSKGTSSGAKDIQDIIEILVRRSPLPLSDLLIKTLFPAVCEYIVGTDHSWTQKCALKVIQTYLSAAPQQLIDLRDKDGKNGVQNILRVIVHVLNLDVEREVILVIYETVIVLLKQIGCKLEENVGELLKALLNTIEHKNFALIRCKFWVVYACLLNAKFNTVFNYLAIKESPYGQQDPFECVIYEGFCKEYDSFDGEDREAIKLALGRIRDHGLKNEYSRLHQLMIEETEDGVQKTIPLFSMISKLTK